MKGLSMECSDPKELFHKRPSLERLRAQIAATPGTPHRAARQSLSMAMWTDLSRVPDLPVDLPVPSIHLVNRRHQLFVSVTMLLLQERPQSRTCQFEGLEALFNRQNRVLGDQPGVGGSRPRRHRRRPTIGKHKPKHGRILQRIRAFAFSPKICEFCRPRVGTS